MGVGFCELKALSKRPMAITLCCWIQSETNNITENGHAVHSVDDKTAFKQQETPLWKQKKNTVDRIYYTKSVSWSVSWRWPAVFCSASQLSEPLQARELTKLYAEHGRFWELHYCTGSRVWSQTAPPESTVTFPLWKWCRHNSMALPLTSHHHPARD